jgi:hypothetical protein
LKVRVVGVGLTAFAGDDRPQAVSPARLRRYH